MTTPTPDEFEQRMERLAELAKTATPGPWRRVQDSQTVYAIGFLGDSGKRCLASIDSGGATIPVDQVRSNLEFLAAANPHEIQQLLAAYREKCEEVKTMKSVAKREFENLKDLCEFIDTVEADRDRLKTRVGELEKALDYSSLLLQGIPCGDPHKTVVNDWVKELAALGRATTQEAKGDE